MPLIHSSEIRQKLTECKERIQQRLSELVSNKAVPHLLCEVISVEDLQQIYSVVLNKWDMYELFLENCLHTQVEVSLREPKTNVKMLYTRETYIPFTFYIMTDDNNDLGLVISPKGKGKEKNPDDTHVVNPQAALHEGGHKKGRDAWRVDMQRPEKWIDLRTQSTIASKLAEIERELAIIRDILAGRKDRSIQALSMGGPVYRKEIMSMVNGKPQSVVMYRQSVLSRAAIGDLFQVLAGKVPLPAPLTLSEKHKITACILAALKDGADKGILYQDLKLLNVLVFWDPKQGYSAKLTDYGCAVTVTGDSPGINQYEAVTSLGFESPELSLYFATHKDDKRRCYFDNQKYRSRGRDVREQLQPGNPLLQQFTNNRMSYSRPNPANLMWELGIVLASLYMDPFRGCDIRLHEVLDEIEGLVRGLLAENREERFSLEKAIAEFETCMSTQMRVSPVSCTNMHG